MVLIPPYVLLPQLGTVLDVCITSLLQYQVQSTFEPLANLVYVNPFLELLYKLEIFDILQMRVILALCVLPSTLPLR